MALPRYAERLEAAHEHGSKLNLELAGSLQKLQAKPQDEIARKASSPSSRSPQRAHDIEIRSVRTASFLIERK